MAIYDELRALNRPTVPEQAAVPEPVEVNDEPGAFMSFLGWIDRPGQVVRNLITGNVTGAGKQLADFFLDPVDAVLPFDVIPGISGRQDYVEGSDILGLDEDAHWATRLAADIGVGIVTDPLTYLLPGVGIGSKAAKAGAGASRKAIKAFKSAKRTAAGWRSAADDLVSKAAKLTAEALESDKAAKALAEAAKVGTASVDDAERAAAKAATAFSEANKLKSQARQAAEMASKSAPTAHDAANAARALENPIGKFGIPFTDIGWNLPVNYQQMDAVLKKIGAVGRSVTPQKLREGVALFADKFGRSLKGGLGWLTPSKQLEDLATRAVALGSNLRDTELKWFQKAFSGVKAGSPMDKAIQSVMHNIDVTNPAAKLSDVEDIATRVAVAADKFGVDKSKLGEAVDQVTNFFQTQGQNLEDIGAVTSKDLLADYYPRYFEGSIVDKSGKLAGDVVDQITTTSSLRHRTLKNTDEVIDFLREQGGATRLQDSAMKTIQQRIMQQADIATKAEMTNKLLGPTAKITDKTTRDSMATIIDAMLKADPDSGAMLKTLMQGNPPRGWFADVLAANNRIFKPAATFGLLGPRVSFQIRNKLSSIWQHFGTSDFRGAWRASKSVASDVYGAFNDGLRSVGLGLPQTKLGKRLRLLDDAMEAADGSLQKMATILKTKDPRLLEAIEAGVLDGYVSTEGILNAWAQAGKGLKAKTAQYLQAPAVVTQGMENRMRLASFLDLRARGKSVAEAARLTKDALLDYSLLKGTGAYANMRNFIPFLAFTAQSIPQQARFLYRTPAMAVALAQVFGQHSEEPVLPWISGQTNFRVGQDREGNPLYMTSFGLPVEVLGDIPDLSNNPREAGKRFRESVIGASHPLLKAAYGYITGQDPFFQSTYGSYDKTPAVLTAMGAPERSEASRLYREIASTGILQPIVSAEQQVSRLFDDRFSPAERALMTTTGMRLASSDPDKAMLQILQEKLRSDPSAKIYETYMGGSDETDALIGALRGARKRMKVKKEQREAAQRVQ